MDRLYNFGQLLDYNSMVLAKKKPWSQELQSLRVMPGVPLIPAYVSVFRNQSWGWKLAFHISYSGTFPMFYSVTAIPSSHSPQLNYKLQSIFSTFCRHCAIVVLHWWLPVVCSWPVFLCRCFNELSFWWFCVSCPVALVQVFCWHTLDLYLQTQVSFNSGKSSLINH